MLQSLLPLLQTPYLRHPRLHQHPPLQQRPLHCFLPLLQKQMQPNLPPSRPHFNLLLVRLLHSERPLLRLNKPPKRSHSNNPPYQPAKPNHLSLHSLSRRLVHLLYFLELVRQLNPKSRHHHPSLLRNPPASLRFSTNLLQLLKLLRHLQHQLLQPLLRHLAP